MAQIKMINSVEELQQEFTSRKDYFLACKRLRHTMGSQWDGPYIKGEQDCLQLFSTNSIERTNRILRNFSYFIPVIIDNYLFLLREKKQIEKAEYLFPDIIHYLVECGQLYFDI